jgi:Domain of unknown function (DUF929)
MRNAIVAGLLVAACVPASAFAAKRSDGSTTAPTSVVAAVSSVPAATLDGVGVGRLGREYTLTRLSGAAVAPGTKATLISENAAWCPHCAANSWAVAIALERFGTLTGLRLIDSGTYYGKVLHAKPAFPHTHGLSFLDAHYVSSLVAFQPIVLFSRTGKPVETPTRAQAQAIKSFEPHGSFPAVDIGGAFGAVGSAFSPGRLAGLSAAKIASELASPTSAVAPYIDAQANVLTAALCVATAQQPTPVCSAPGVRTAAATLPTG